MTVPVWLALVVTVGIAGTAAAPAPLFPDTPQVGLAARWF